MNKDNDFVTNFEKASLDWYNSTDNNGHPIKSNNSIRSSKSNTYYRSGFSLGIFKIIIFCLVLVVLYRYLRTGAPSDFSFKSLIEILSNAPVIDFGLADFDFTIYSNWGWANFLRDYINLFTDIWELLFSLVNMIWQGLIFLFYIVRSLFVI